MNRDKLKEIINDDLIQNWENKLLEEIAKDPAAITCVLVMLSSERNEKRELITDLNFQLSRAHLALVEPKTNKGGFVQNKIFEFYKTGKIKHCLKMEGLE